MRLLLSQISGGAVGGRSWCWRVDGRRFCAVRVRILTLGAGRAWVSGHETIVLTPGEMPILFI